MIYKSYDDPFWFLPTTIATQPGDSNISKSNSEIFLGRSWTGTPCVFVWQGIRNTTPKKRSDTQKLPKVGDVRVLTHNEKTYQQLAQVRPRNCYLLCKPIIDTEWNWNNYAKTQVITPQAKHSKTDKLFWFTVSQKQQGLNQTAILT